MGKFYDEIPEFIVPWINQQKMFWVASAPLNPDGHVNLSPKGFEGTFHIVNSKQVWYEDMTGSGIETISHLRENGRITILFTAFQGPPRICRMFGRGTVYEFDTPEYNKLIQPDKRQPGSRSVIVVDVYKVGTSCGFSIPYYTFDGIRTQLHEMAASMEDKDITAEKQLLSSPDAPLLQLAEGGLKSYWGTKNQKSLDGLPGLCSAHESRTRFEHVDPKALKNEKGPWKGAHGSRDYPLLATWATSQVMVAFTLGAVAATTALKFLPSQR